MVEPAPGRFGLHKPLFVVSHAVALSAAVYVSAALSVPWVASHCMKAVSRLKVSLQHSLSFLFLLLLAWGGYVAFRVERLVLYVADPDTRIRVGVQGTQGRVTGPGPGVVDFNLGCVSTPPAAAMRCSEFLAPLGFHGAFVAVKRKNFIDHRPISLCVALSLRASARPAFATCAEASPVQSVRRNSSWSRGEAGVLEEDS